MLLIPLSQNTVYNRRWYCGQGLSVTRSKEAPQVKVRYNLPSRVEKEEKKGKDLPLIQRSEQIMLRRAHTDKARVFSDRGAAYPLEPEIASLNNSFDNEAICTVFFLL